MLVDPAGLVVTNHHVIDGADQVKVSLADRREFEAEIVLKDARSDLAVLRIKGNGERFPALEFADSDALQVGDLVLAIGNPFGVGQTVTHGIVSALARTQVGITDYQFFIQTDAAINPGNSGGALVDMSGRLVGINTAIFSRGGGSIGIGFAIPANMVRVVVASARGGSTCAAAVARRAAAGGDARRSPKASACKRPAGALVAQVTRTVRRHARGLRTGDLIVALDDQEIEDPNAFDYRFATKPIGGTSRIRIAARRQGDDGDGGAGSGARAAARRAHRSKSRSPFQGARVSNLSPALAEQLRLDPGAEGVVIVDVANGSIGQRFFQRGDVVLTVNNQKIDRTRDLDRLTRQQSRAVADHHPARRPADVGGAAGIGAMLSASHSHVVREVRSARKFGLIAIVLAIVALCAANGGILDLSPTCRRPLPRRPSTRRSCSSSTALLVLFRSWRLRASCSASRRCFEPAIASCSDRWRAL